MSAAGQPATSKNLVEGRLLLALPAALSTGMTTGVEAAFTRGRTLAWGVRASWSTATEYTLAWTVRNDDVRLRLLGVLQHSTGRGTFGLRLGAGGTLVHEILTANDRGEGYPLGRPSDATESTSWSLLPAADLELTLTLRLWGAWGVILSGGPSIHVLHGTVQPGWISGLGVTWQD